MKMLKLNSHKIYLSIIIILVSVLIYTNNFITFSKSDGVVSVNLVYGNITPNSVKIKE